MTAEEAGVPFGQRLIDLAADQPDRVAVVLVHRDGSEERLSRRDLDEAATQWGQALGQRGVGLGDRVAIAIHNSVEFVLGALGAWKLGGVPVPVRWDLPTWERERVLAVVDAVVVIDDESVEELRDNARSTKPRAPAVVTPPQSFGICSSGSTGTPKVIVNARPGLWTETASTPFATEWDGVVTRPQVILVPAPMYHTNGFMTLYSMLGGDQLVILEKFDATLALDVIERHRVTTFTATPTMLQRIAAVHDIDSRDLSGVEWILQGAAMMPPALLRRWFELLAPERIVMAYGMTEQLGLTALRGDEWLTHPGSVGRGFRETEVKILDEHQLPVPVGEYGDVYLRWPSTGSYDYRGGAALLPTTSDGFGTAGDMGKLDEDGFLYLADRRVDMIVTGGANVFPAEVESALSEHQGIADVVVIGLADAEWGRRVHAVVERQAGHEELSGAEVVSFAKSRLASYKAPKTVEFVDEMPRTAATKISRAALVAARGG